MGYLSVEIKNWKELKDHFGLDMAKKLSIGLKKEVYKILDDLSLPPDRINTVAVNYDEEGYAIFNSTGAVLTDEHHDSITYEFNGTAK
jgi:hypothetical protein